MEGDDDFHCMILLMHENNCHAMSGAGRRTKKSTPAMRSTTWHDNPTNMDGFLLNEGVLAQQFEKRVTRDKDKKDNQFREGKDKGARDILPVMLENKNQSSEVNGKKVLVLAIGTSRTLSDNSAFQFLFV